MQSPKRAAGDRRSRQSKPQKRAEVTQTTVLVAAVAEFAQHGLDGARVDRIARRAGVNKQAIYYHFRSKEDLYQASLASAYSKPPPVERFWAMPDLSPELAMRALITSFFEHFRHFEDGRSLIAHENRYRGKHLTPRIQQQIRTYIAPLIRAVSDILERGQRQGVFSKDINGTDLYLTLLAETMFYFTHAYTLSAILQKDLLSDKAVDNWKAHVERFVLASLRRQP